ncbi:MAG: transposase family protein [Firmicutes bacterium]|nr:transposase family protein [Bacillota bacterium]
MAQAGARPPLREGNPGTLPNTKVPYQTVAEEQAAREQAVTEQLKVWRQHLPAIFQKLGRIADPRRPGSVRHRVVVVLFYGLLLFVFQYASRREANRHATSPALAEALRQVFPDIQSIPHYDTVERLLRAIPVDDWEAVLQDRITTLLRKHAVQQYLVDHHWVVAIDGTQKFARHQPFAPEALRRQIADDVGLYRVYVLEAILVTGQGLSLPLLTEFAENRGDGDEDTKQDSEQKAFHRLARRLKQWFPRRRLLLVMDGLYPNGPIMTLCRQYHWDFMIVLPRNSLASVWDEVAGLIALDTEDAQYTTHRWGERDQAFRWANDIEYTYRTAAGHLVRQRVHVALCQETWRDGAGQPQRALWAWISSQPLSAANIVARCNRAGRHRWAIEAEFLVEKRHGDHFEHAFSYDWTALKGWHYLMKLAHLLNVLTLWSTIGAPLLNRRGYRDAVGFLRDTWTGRWLSPQFLQAWCIGSLAP